MTVNLVEAGLLPPMVSSFLEGGGEQLLAPVRFQLPGSSIPTVPAPKGDRSELAAALAVANRSFQHPAADDLGQKLADPATAVVITGQQPGLFGGPLYSLSKAVAAARWAEHLERNGTSAVALFWIASEDHDFRESSRAAFLSPTGPRIFDLGEDPSPLEPMGLRRLGAEVERVLAELREAVPGERFAAWVDELGRWYSPDNDFGEAFAGLMVHLLGERAPLMVDALLPELKQAQVPWLEGVVELRHEIAGESSGREAAIRDAGYSLQVRPRPGSSPLFLLHEGQRRRIEWRGENRWALRGAPGVEGEVETLLTMIEETPEIVSPGVLARSAIQDAVFGTCLQVLGPGELAYLPQVASLYSMLEIEPPSVALRPQALVLEDHVAKKLEATGLALSDWVDPDLELDDHLAGSAGEEFLTPARERLAELLGELKAPSLELDSGLEGPLRKTGEQMTRALDSFGGKVKAASVRREQTAARRLETVRSNLRPLGRWQERVIATGYYPGKYDRGFSEAMLEQLDEQDPINLQVVRP